MAVHRSLVFALVAALQLLAWREVVPVCASMAHCGGTPATRSLGELPTTVSGTADCCKGGSVRAPAVVSPLPQRAQTVTPVVVALALAVPAPSTARAADHGRAAADAPPPLPPLLSGCILRI